MNQAQIIENGWNAAGQGNFDALAADYVDDMAFIMPGQSDVLQGRQAFRSTLGGLGDALPPGFEITGLRNIQGDGEVVSIVEWKSDKVPASQCCVLFKFRGDKIFEERWFVDTEQWKGAF